MNSKTRWAIRVTFLAVSVLSIPALAHDDGPHSPRRAMNGLRDGVQGKAMNGLRDGVQGRAMNGLWDGVQREAMNGMQDRVRPETRNDPLTSWITSAPEVKAERLEMAHYIVQCAMAPGDDRIVHIDGKTITFRGVFGLLPSWTSGNAMSDAEYRLLIACLGAHVNPLGEHVPISIRGPGIRVDSGEPEEFPIREGAFFALANGSGALTTYACSADFAPHEGDDSRLCSEPGRCLSVVGLGSCSNICHLDDEGNFLCSNGGLEIAGVLTTYMKSRMN